MPDEPPPRQLALRARSRAQSDSGRFPARAIERKCARLRSIVGRIGQGGCWRLSGPKAAEEVTWRQSGRRNQARVSCPRGR